jgi:hypothetical protein
MTGMLRLLGELLTSQQVPSGTSGQTAAEPPQVDTKSLDPAMVGKRYSTHLKASGGFPPYQWAVVPSEPLPPGLVLDQMGTISGIPKGESIYRFTVQVADAKDTKSGDKDFSLIVVPRLTITSDISRNPSPARDGKDVIADLHAEGGSPDYTWECAPGSLPPGIELSQEGRIRGTPGPGSRGTRRLTVECTDKAGYSDKADFFIKVAGSWPKWHWRRSDGRPRIAGRSITVRSSLRDRLFRPSHYLFFLGLAIPVVGLGSILAYVFAIPGGSTWAYLGVGALTAFSAFLVGGLAGFLLGIPRLVSSGVFRQQGGPQYAPSSNLAEVSDWLTKLLLGAGLVSLTHLGAPIAHLINHVAHGLYVLPASRPAAQAMAGAILFGYVAIGLLDGYVMTTLWYQNWLAKNTVQT